LQRILLLVCLLVPAAHAQGAAPELDPVAARLASARDAYASGALGDAQALLEEALEAAPEEPDVRLWLARVQNDLGHGEEALETLAPALAAAPRSAWLLVERGRAELALGHADLAEAAYRAALAAYPTLGSARLALAGILGGAKRADEGLEVLQPLLALDPAPAEVVIRHAELLGVLHRDAEGEAVLRADIDDPSVRLALCRWLAERDRNDEAWQVGEPAIGGATSPAARTLLAQVARRAGQPLDCLRLLGAVLLDDPTHEAALAELGELLEDAPDLERMVVTRRVEARPDDPEAWRELLEGDLRAGDVDGFFQRFGKVPADLRAAPAIALLRGQALRRAGKNDQARAALEPLCSGGSTRACYELGLIAYSEGRAEDAAAAFARGADGAWAPDAHFNRGVCLDRLGRFAEAAEAYAAAVAARPDFPEAWLQLGNDRRLRLGDAAGAREAYRHYIDLGGDDPEVRRFLGGKTGNAG